MTNLSEEKEFTFEHGKDIENHTLYLTSPTIIANVYIKVERLSEFVNNFTISASYVNVNGNALLAPFEKVTGFNPAYLIPGKGTISEHMSANLVTIKYEEAKNAEAKSNGLMKFKIQALHITDEERVAIERL
jgi:hypothetical protein